MKWKSAASLTDSCSCVQHGTIRIRLFRQYRLKNVSACSVSSIKSPFMISAFHYVSYYSFMIYIVIDFFIIDPSSYDGYQLVYNWFSKIQSLLRRSFQRLRLQRSLTTSTDCRRSTRSEPMNKTITAGDRKSVVRHFLNVIAYVCMS